MKRLTRKEQKLNYKYRYYGYPRCYNDMNSKGDYTIGECIDKLGELEDIEQEIGIGITNLFSLPNKEIYSINPIDKTIFVEKVICVGIDKELKWCYLFVDKKVGDERYPVRYFTTLNILWFLTREEAEKKLEELNK